MVPATAPLYSHTGKNADDERHKYVHERESHPRHRLAVQAVALDMSTALSLGHDALDAQGATPGGILYTGGRDGLLCSWELNLPTKKRRRPYGRNRPEDDEEVALDSDDDDVAIVSDPPDQWEIDDDAVRRLSSPPKARFRQCIQSHTDWVNDIVLANHNRTLVSASSDSLVLAWNPHSSDHHDQVTPTPIGRHADYVRCLATGRDSNWVASAGFDRKIKLWDVVQGRSNAPIVELASPPGSVYSLGTTPTGSLIAAGTPERIVRVWDPRSRKQVSRLGGHTDNIRAVLLSDDGKFLLSASSDSTVKLWSLAAQKCLHTFSHHADSVWSLTSQHPALEIFYSGDRSGNLCKVDIEGVGDPTDGECILLSRDGPEDSSDRIGHEGITQMVSQDDHWIWTAAGSSSVKRWRDVPNKSRRAGAIVQRAKENGDLAMPEDRATDSPAPSESGRSGASPIPLPPTSPERDRPGPHSVSFLEGLTSPLGRTSSSPTTRPGFPQLSGSSHRPSSLRTPRQSLLSAGARPPLENLVSNNPSTSFDIPFDSLIPLTLPEDTYFAPAFSNRNRDPDAATIYSTVSGISAHRPALVSAASSSHRRPMSIADTVPEATNIAQRDYLERESAAEAVPLRTAPDDLIEGGYGLVRCELLNDRVHALTQDTEDDVSLWDIVRGVCLGVFDRPELQNALATRRASDGGAASVSSHQSNGHGFDMLDYVRERIEGEVSIATWCKCDTRVGALTIHLEEARAFDAESYIEECGVGPVEDYPPDHRLSLGKWVLRQLFDGFVEAEMALRVPEAGQQSPQPQQPSALFGNNQAGPPAFISLADLASPGASSRAKGPRTPGMTIALATPALKKAVLPDLPPPVATATSPRFGNTELAPIPQSPAGQTPLASHAALPAGGKTPTLERPDGDYFSLQPTAPDPLVSPGGALASPTMRAAEPPTPTGTTAPLPTPGGTLMGRLRAFGKTSKKASNAPEAQSLATPILQPIVADNRTIEEQQQQQVLDSVFAHPLTPCGRIEAPPLRYDPDMAIIISEEMGDAWTVKYRGLVGTSYDDMSVLEQKAPRWLLEFLLGNRTPFKEPAKVSFVMQAWKGDDQHHALPELPNQNARLSANRSLRIRKVCAYVADKLDLRRPSRAPSIVDGASRPPSIRSSPSVGSTLFGEFDPEREIEILVNGEVLPVHITLATVRHCMWKNGGDVVFQYRSKREDPPL
ncbi:hypothetical protein Rhopal_004609-T1 [Rhodotorula paludigena]|uniref:WD40 repeat-like protein n=1 Tax=Rhodotorula paludigena TaxID=86838 RepID=A0AAV5GPX3_9BASI|nr:hypothetical protein Rhopal_004609-T1 [Rhodotorula paludigena]